MSPNSSQLNPSIPTSEPPRVLLLGAGVVGRSIGKAHLEVGIPFVLADQSESALSAATDWLCRAGSAAAEPPGVADVGMPAVRIVPKQLRDSQDATSGRWIVIESVIEQLAVKQRLFSELSEQIGESVVLCTNTSTLRIADIASGLDFADKLCGMHFFMPIVGRDAVEIIPHGQRGRGGTSESTITAVVRHAKRLGKRPIEVVDSPGFLVNRLLSPYLNQSLLLLTTGASAEQIESAAKSFGMPISPLELIDWIGAQTMFHAGRVFWQSFPDRLDPSPMVAGLIKRKRWGRQVDGGLYDYDGDTRSSDLSVAATELVERYRIDSRSYTNEDVEMILSIPMWIESQLALRDGVIKTPEMLEAAMLGGLGFQNPLGWNGYFESMGRPTIDQAIKKWSPTFRSMRLPQ